MILSEVQLNLFESPEETLSRSRAEFSPDRRHRYALWRTWDKDGEVAMFLCLNPSTATEIKNDPTVSRCIEFAKRWGYGGMIMANIFAYRATDPDDMKNVPDPVGPDNDKWLNQLADESDLIVIAWGNHGLHLDRSKSVMELMAGRQLHYLEFNDNGEPKHPLYCSGQIRPSLIPPGGPIEIKNMHHLKRPFGATLRPEYDVVIDRSSPLGNPHHMRQPADRDEACDLYDEWFQEAVVQGKNPKAAAEFERLKSLYLKHKRLRLFCWCFPARCHGETIRRELLEGLEESCF